MTMFLKAGASLRKALAALVGADMPVTWTDWTPTVTQAGSGVTITITYARYAIVGKTALVQTRIAVTGAGPGTGSILVASIPSAIAFVRFDDVAMSAACGAGQIADGGTPIFYPGTAVARSASTVSVVGFGQANVVGVAPAFTLANGDFITLDLMYEIA